MWIVVSENKVCGVVTSVKCFQTQLHVNTTEDNIFIVSFFVCCCYCLFTRSLT